MLTENNFNLLLGKTITLCQQIENDVKIMYACMLEGNFDKNYDYIKEETLGHVLAELERLDNSDRKPFLSKKDYDLLFMLNDLRVYWVHKGSLCFCYENCFKYHSKLKKQYLRLKENYDTFVELSKEVNNIKYEMLKYFGR